MNTANKITLLRVAFIPAFIVAMALSDRITTYVALAIFIIASVTDFIDGYIARNYDQVTTFGKFLDPLADKLLVMSALLILVERGQMPGWIAIVILAREFAVTGLRLVAVEKGRVIAAAWSGKIKTASSLIAICVMLTGLNGLAVIPGVMDVNLLCSIVMLIVTVYSGIEYFAKNKDVLDTGNAK